MAIFICRGNKHYCLKVLMHEPLARIGDLEAGYVRAGKASNERGPAVGSAEADIGRTLEHCALRILEIHLEISLGIYVSDRVGGGKGDPEVACLIESDTVGESHFAQKVRPVDFGWTQLVSVYDAVA